MKGRWRIRGNKLASKIRVNKVARSADTNCSDVKDGPETASVPSTLISIFSITRRAPNWMVLIVPLAGEAHLTSGLVLSKNNGEPIKTESPSLTIRLGFTPMNFLGEMATDSDPAMETTSLDGTPPIRILCPFLITIWFMD